MLTFLVSLIIIGNIIYAFKEYDAHSGVGWILALLFFLII